jgi:hypothetical protein
MSRAILKPDNDVDLYAVYSENTDAILFVGDREAVRRWLADDETANAAERSPVVIEGRLERATEYGSSSAIPLGKGNGVLYGWHDLGIRIMEGPGGPGNLPRGALFVYCCYVRDDDLERAAACVLPDEDEE